MADEHREVQWHESVELIQPHVVRISTPRGSGTGFLISHGVNTAICGIATAAHVVSEAHYWRSQSESSTPLPVSMLVRHPQRAIFLDPARDTAAILFNKGEVSFPNDTLPIAPKGMHLRVGYEIGWIGYPAIPAASLCFFGGRVSAWLQEGSAYLVDGVAINGVSGGPAFHCAPGRPVVMGVVSAYMPNRATGEVLPGVAIVRDVAQFHDLAPTFASLDQAKSKESPPEQATAAPEAPAGDGEVPARRVT